MSLVHRLLTAGFSVCMLLAAATSCVTNGTMGGVGGGGNNPVVFSINGRQVKADELIKSRAFHQGFQQFAYVEMVRQAAAKEGIKPDPAEVDKKIEEQKRQFATMNMKWEDVLKQQGMTDADVREMIEMQELNTQLMKKLAGDVSDADIADAWAKRKDEILRNYAATKSLSEAQRKEAESKGVADPALKDFIKEDVSRMKEQQGGQQAVMKMLREMKVELPPLGDAKTQEEYVQKIFKANLPPDPEEEKKKAEEEAAKAKDEGAATEGSESSGQTGETSEESAGEGEAAGDSEGAGTPQPPPPAKTPPPPAGSK